MPNPLDNIVQLSDRVKELSYTEGTGNMVLEGAAAGFSTFSESYAHSGLVYYAITDGVNYEVGSGHYLNAVSDPAISTDELRRYPFVSNIADNGKVTWTAGTKEVYVTYPATHSVYTASGVDPKYIHPAASGLAFWETNSILNYDSSGVWDRTNHRLGIHNTSPQFAIDIGGDKSYSLIRASGFIADASGIVFSGVDYATRQTEPFLRTQIDDYPYTITNATGLLATSGAVDEYLLLVSQTAGQVFASPANDCVGGCEPGFPSFRALHASDMPDLSSLSYVTTYKVPEPPFAYSGVAFYHSSGVIGWDGKFVWDSGSDRLGVGVALPEATLHVGGAAIIDSDITVKGDLDVRGDLTYISSSTVTIDDKNLELASLSGNALYMDSYVDTGGISLLSSGDGNYDTGDKRLYWENSSNTWKTDIQRADTSTQLIGITTSGIVFDNGTAISGAYQGGSGISINGFNIDIGNVFSLGASPTQNIHQGDIVFVSGVNGIATSMGSFPAEAAGTVTVTDFAELNTGDKVNLIATDGTNYDFTNGDQDSVAGTWESATSNDQTATNLMNVVNTSSGPAGTRFSASVVGAVVTITQNTGGGAGNTAITLTDSAPAGLTKTDFTGGTDRTHAVYVDPTQLSGVLNDNMIASGVAVSGWARDAIYNSGVAISGWAGDAIYNSGVAISGWAGDAIYNSGVAISGWAGDAIYNSGVAISGWARDWTNYTSGTLNDDMIASGVAVSGWARDYVNYTSGTLNDDMIASGLAISGWARDWTNYTSGTLNDDMIASGYAILAAASETGEENQNAFSYISSDGYTVAADAKTDTFIVASGHDNSVWVSGNGVDTITISGAHNFFLRGDSDAGAGGSQVLHNDAVTMSGGYGITTTRAGDLVTVAWSGSDYVDAGDAATGVAANAYTDTRAAATGVAANAYTDTRVAATGATNAAAAATNATNIAATGATNAAAAATNATNIAATGVAANAYTDTQVAAENLTMIASGVAVSGWVRHGFTYDWLSDPASLTAMTETTMEGDDTLIIWDEGNSLWKKVTLTELDDEIGAGADVGDPNEPSFKTITADNDGVPAWGYTYGTTDILAITDTDTLNLAGSGDVSVVTNVANKTILIHDNGIVSGIAVAASSDIAQVSGTLDTRITNSGVAVSGWAGDAIYNSGVAVSGWARDYTLKASGYLNSDIAQVSGTLDTRITNSGVAVSGWARDYTLKASGYLNDAIYNSGVAISGWAGDAIYNSGVAVSGWAGDAIYNSGVAISGWAGDAIYNSGVAISGWARDWTNYTSGTLNDDMISSGLAISGWARDSMTSFVDLTQVSGTLDTRISNSGVAVSGWARDYTLKASGHLNSDMIASGVAVSGWARDYTLKASGHLNSDMIASGVAVSGWARDWTNYTSGTLNDDMIASGTAASGPGGYATYGSVHNSGIVLVDLPAGDYGGSTDAGKYFQLNKHWYQKWPAKTQWDYADPGEMRPGVGGISYDTDNMALGSFADAYRYGSYDWGTISIGGLAGASPDATRRASGSTNINIGYKAGYDQSLPPAADVYMLGGEYESQFLAPKDSINIGHEAGSEPNPYGLNALVSRRGNIFIGTRAGKGCRGHGTLSIGDFYAVQDWVNGADPGSTFGSVNDRFNIANTICGKSSPGFNRVAIGSISLAFGKQIAATLELRGAGTLATASTFHIAQSDSTTDGYQTGSLMTTAVPATTARNWAFNGSSTNMKNEIINREGFLRIPIFDSKNDLKALHFASDSPGMVCIVKDGGVRYIVISDGATWKSAWLNNL